MYLSDQDTVFQTPQAREVSHWLQACAEPDNPRLLKAALSSPTLGQDYAALEALNHDEMAWEERLLQFKGYQEIWRRQGVLPLIRRILLDFNCASRLLPGPPDALGQSGERVLTDVLHLAELLQQASFTLEGEHALLRFLAEQLANPKAGVAGMTRSFAKELGSRGITVNCVAPGFIATDMTEVLPEAQKEALMSAIPLGRLGAPEDIAHAVAFLASSQAGYITGTELHVNGGMWMN